MTRVMTETEMEPWQNWLDKNVQAAVSTAGEEIAEVVGEVSAAISARQDRQFRALAEAIKSLIALNDFVGERKDAANAILRQIEEMEMESAASALDDIED
jgi:hypothetical protein